MGGEAGGTGLWRPGIGPALVGPESDVRGEERTELRVVVFYTTVRQSASLVLNISTPFLQLCRSELRRCVKRVEGLGSHSLSHSSPVSDKLYVFCGYKAQ